MRTDVVLLDALEELLAIVSEWAALVKPMMDMSFGLIEKKWFAKMQFKSLKMKTELFETPVL